MQRIIEIETSQFSDNPTKRWVGLDYLVEDCYVEYPPELDNLDDDVLLRMADNEEGGVSYASLPNTACTRLETGAANADSESNPAVSSG